MAVVIWYELYVNQGCSGAVYYVCCCGLGFANVLGVPVADFLLLEDNKADDAERAATVNAAHFVGSDKYRDTLR